MSRIALGISYCGHNYNGWQTQPNRNTIQDYLESALQQFLGGPNVATICAGRTDTKVHALQQVVHLDTNIDRRNQSWIRGLNAILPADIRVQWALPVADKFHARFDAMQRTYYYLLQSSPVRSAIFKNQVGWVHYELDIQAMRSAAQLLLGEHDFSSFRSSQCQAASPVRTLIECDIASNNNFLLFKFTANAFLHHMVRNLMGMLLFIGRGRRSYDWVTDLLQAKDRRYAAPTFMADGLYLAQVQYPREYGLPVLSPEAALKRYMGFI